MRISPDKSCERRRIHLDRVGIREPDLHADRLADQQLPLWKYANAIGELGDENFKSCSLGTFEWPREPLFGAALFFVRPVWRGRRCSRRKGVFSRNTRYNAGTERQARRTSAAW